MTATTLEDPWVAAADTLSLVGMLVDVESISGNEGHVCDLVERRLRARAPHLLCTRLGSNLIARTPARSQTRIVLAGHLDTVPGKAGATWLPEGIGGLGAVDMKAGVGVMLSLAERCADATADLTFVFYDKEEAGSLVSGMRTLWTERPDLAEGDVAILLEPTGSVLEAGCQGNLIVELTFNGEPAHTARPWRGRNAVHAAAPVVERLARFDPPPVTIDGLEYIQSLQVVSVSAGKGANVVPDLCTAKVNYRHAPATSVEEAVAIVSDLAPEADDLRVVLASPPAAPSLDHPILRELRAYVPGPVRPKLGWTDVGRFAQYGMPAINFGPGDPELAHSGREVVTREEVQRCEAVLSKLIGAGEEALCNPTEPSN